MTERLPAVVPCPTHAARILLTGKRGTEPSPRAPKLSAQLRTTVCVVRLNVPPSLPSIGQPNPSLSASAFSRDLSRPVVYSAPDLWVTAIVNSGLPEYRQFTKPPNVANLNPKLLIETLMAVTPSGSMPLIDRYAMVQGRARNVSSSPPTQFAHLTSLISPILVLEVLLIAVVRRFPLSVRLHSNLSSPATNVILPSEILVIAPPGLN